MTKRKQPRAEDLAALDQVPTPDLLRTLLPVVRQAFNEVVNSKNYVLFDQVAKDPMSTARLLDGAQKLISRRPQ